MSENTKPLEPAPELRRMLERTQEREAIARGALAQAAYWLDQGGPGKALDVIRQAMITIDRNREVEDIYGR